MERHFTATAFIVENHKTFLIFHKKHSKWLPPGGHVEKNETPPECAIREVEEETGYQVKLCRQENFWIDHPCARSFERPYFCLLEDIPANAKDPAHQHMDFVYVCTPYNQIACQEDLNGRWFTLDDIDQLQVGHDIYPDTVEVLKIILKKDWTL
ncbi:MAG: NUDIX domain-containing protein [Parachlamydiales bacterium]|nr:NUDIX domain-containing protein [Parachlamydiales bacterium]